MTFAWTIVVLVVLLAIVWRYLGSYMAAVFEGRARWLAAVERPIYRVIGVSAESEQTWKRYSGSVIVFSGVALLVTYVIFRLQGMLPWVDMVRATLYVLLPIAFVAAIVFMAQGALQTLAGPVHMYDALNGVHQIIPRGPVASQETIKQLGTNGGGFFNTNGASPFENPTGLTNLLSILLILCIPVGLTYTFGKMVGSVRQGAATAP